MRYVPSVPRRCDKKHWVEPWGREGSVVTESQSCLRMECIASGWGSLSLDWFRNKPKYCRTGKLPYVKMLSEK